MGRFEMGNWREEREKVRANGAAKVVVKEEDLSEEDFLEDVAEFEEGISEGTSQGNDTAEVSSNVPGDLELNARLTAYKMIASVPQLDQPFQFKTVKFGGKAHVQAMRQALSRARADLRAANLKQGVRFKLFLVSVEHFPTYDLVTVMRSAHPSLKQKRASDEIVQLLAETEAGETGEQKR